MKITIINTVCVLALILTPLTVGAHLHKKLKNSNLTPLKQDTPMETIKGYLKIDTTGELIPEPSYTVYNSVRPQIIYTNWENYEQYVAEIDVNMYSVTLPQGVYERTISMAQYTGLPSVESVTSSSDETNENNTIFLSPNISSSFRVRLTWNDLKGDVDLFVRLPDESEICWNRKQNFDGTNYLDNDYKGRSGTETININDVMIGTHLIYVRSYHFYRHLIDFKPRIDIYSDKGLVATVEIDKRLGYASRDLHVDWIVGEIVVEFGSNLYRFLEINELSGDKWTPKYED